MTRSLLKKLISFILCLFFVIGVFSQNIRFPNGEWQYEEMNSCRIDSRCIARNRCPPSRRLRKAPQCFYDGRYYRRTPGVCCRTRNIALPVIPPTQPPIAPDIPSFPRNDVQECQGNTRCIPLSRCPPPRRPTMDNAPTCSYGGVSRICCAYTRRRGLNVENTIPPVISTTTTTTTVSPTNTPREDCGRSLSTSGLMIGGAPARPGVWPWMAALTKMESDGTYSLWCTGSLIDRTHVLTAAHCFNEDRDVALYILRIGNVDLRLGDAYNIRELAIPDTYQIGRFYSDIAILTLERPVTTPDFMPICLPTPVFRNFTGRGVTLAGWGSTSPGGPTSDILQQLVSMPVVSSYLCDSIFRRRLSDFDTQFPNGINSNFICAGFLEGGRDSCGGDSGGPMMVPDGGRWYQIGVVSFGHARCATPGFPAGYTRVSEFIDFILSNL